MKNSADQKVINNLNTAISDAIITMEGQDREIRKIKIKTVIIGILAGGSGLAIGMLLP